MCKVVNRCSHKRLAERTHEFVLMEASIPALDELFNLVDAILHDTPYPCTIYLLIDSSVGTPPVGYCLTRIRALAKKYPRREAGRIAFVLRPQSPFIRMFDILMRQYGDVRFFEPSQRAEAVEWLLRR